jgi:predicted ATP-dependent serine protease
MNDELTCKKCGATVTSITVECPKCGAYDPSQQMAEEAKRTREYHIKEAETFKKKMSGVLPLDADAKNPPDPLMDRIWKKDKD